MSAHGPTSGAVAEPAPPPPAPPGALEAVLLAGPPSALPFAGGTLLDRLRGQLASLGAQAVHVVAAEDLRALAALARSGDGPLVIAARGLLAHREALATL